MSKRELLYLKESTFEFQFQSIPERGGIVLKGIAASLGSHCVL